jgi:ribonuclease HI
VAIFSGKKLVTNLKYKLDNRCSNNQAEHLVTAKALEALETTDIEKSSPRTAAIITDSRISLVSIKNINNHSNLIEEIWERLSKLERSNWTVDFAWVKTRTGILENELADQLAKTAARTKDKTTTYSRITLSKLFRELQEESKLKWQHNWEENPQAAQTLQFYPSITNRLKSKKDITSNFKVMVTGHGKTGAYLHQFKLLESAKCSCNKGDQTTDHLLYHCILLQQQREILEKDTLKHGIWPISKHDSITKHLKPFMKYTNSIDFDKL